MLDGSIRINRNVLLWPDVPKGYGPHKSLYTRWKRCGDKGISGQIKVSLAAGRAPVSGTSYAITTDHLSL